MVENKRSELDSLKLKLALGLTLFTIVSMLVMNPPYNPNVRGAGGVFPVGQNVTMGNFSKTVLRIFWESASSSLYRLSSITSLTSW